MFTVRLRCYFCGQEIQNYGTRDIVEFVVRDIQNRTCPRCQENRPVLSIEEVKKK